MPRIRRLLLLLILFALWSACGCGGKAKSRPATPSSPAAPAAPNVGMIPAGGPGVVDLSLYVMSDCPYGIPAEKVLHTAAEQLPGQIRPRLVFIVNETSGGALRSLHGEKELQKDMVHACVGQIARAKQLDFIVRHNESSGDWQTVAKDLGLDAAAIEKCVRDGTGEKLLRADLSETTKFNVTASPTIIINGKIYPGAVNSRDFFDAICAALGTRKPPVCEAPPVALSRTDGSASGSCGKRANAVPPEYVDEAPLTQTIVYSETALDKSRMDLVMAQNRQLYPNIKFEKVEAATPEGQKLVQKYHLAQLPAFVFPADMPQRKNFQIIAPHLVKAGDAFLLSPKIGANLFLDRPRTPKTLEVFFSPHSTRAMRMLLDLHDLLALPELHGLGSKIGLRPYAPIENGQIAAPGGPPEVEEMLRLIAVLDTQPNKIWEYLTGRVENPASTWWEDYATKAGIDPAALKKAALGDKAAKELADNSNLAAEFSLAEDFAIVFDNREVARPESKDDLKAMLQKAGK